MMEFSYDKMGQEVRIRRKSLNLSQQQLADKSGVSKGYFSNIERAVDRRSIGIKRLNQLAIALETDIDSLLIDSLVVFDNPDRTTTQILNILQHCTDQQINVYLDILIAYTNMQKQMIEP